MNEKYLTLKQTADRLGLTYGTVRQYVQAGIIPAIKQGKNRMVAEDYVEDMEGRAVLKARYQHKSLGD